MHAWSLQQVVKYLIDEGFYVNIDFHSIGMAGEGLGIAADDNTLYNTTLWVGLWCVHANMQKLVWFTGGLTCIHDVGQV